MLAPTPYREHAVGGFPQPEPRPGSRSPKGNATSISKDDKRRKVVRAGTVAPHQAAQDAGAMLSSMEPGPRRRGSWSPTKDHPPAAQVEACIGSNSRRPSSATPPTSSHPGARAQRSPASSLRSPADHASLQAGHWATMSSSKPVSPAWASSSVSAAPTPAPTPAPATFSTSTGSISTSAPPQALAHQKLATAAINGGAGPGDKELLSDDPEERAAAAAAAAAVAAAMASMEAYPSLDAANDALGNSIRNGAKRNRGDCTLSRPSASNPAVGVEGRRGRRTPPGKRLSRSCPPNKTPASSVRAVGNGVAEEPAKGSSARPDERGDWSSSSGAEDLWRGVRGGASKSGQANGYSSGPFDTGRGSSRLYPSPSPALALQEGSGPSPHRSTSPWEAAGDKNESGSPARKNGLIVSDGGIARGDRTTPISEMSPESLARELEMVKAEVAAARAALQEAEEVVGIDTPSKDKGPREAEAVCELCPVRGGAFHRADKTRRNGAQLWCHCLCALSRGLLIVDRIVKVCRRFCLSVSGCGDEGCFFGLGAGFSRWLAGLEQVRYESWSSAHGFTVNLARSLRTVIAHRYGGEKDPDDQLVGLSDVRRVHGLWLMEAGNEGAVIRSRWSVP